MLRIKRGDRDAFAELVDAWQQPVLNFVTRTLRDPDEAEDVAQSVFVQIYRARERYQPSARFTAWLFTIARNCCLNELRRRSRHRTESLDAPALDPENEAAPQFADPRGRTPDELALVDELELKVEAAVADLPETQRTALLLFQREELPYEDIAKILGVSLSATKSLIHRARETLKQRLKPYLQTGVWEEAEH